MHTQGPQEKLILGSGDPTPRDELAAFLEYGSSRDADAAWLNKHGAAVLALIDVCREVNAGEDGWTHAMWREFEAAVSRLDDNGTAVLALYERLREALRAADVICRKYEAEIERLRAALESAPHPGRDQGYRWHWWFKDRRAALGGKEEG